MARRAGRGWNERCREKMACLTGHADRGCDERYQKEKAIHAGHGCGECCQGHKACQGHVLASQKVL